MKPRTALAVLVCAYVLSYALYSLWRLGYVSGYITGRVESDLLDLKEESKSVTQKLIDRAKGD